jgi:hypothetical protein
MWLTLRGVIRNTWRAIERYDPSNDNWAKTLMFDPARFEGWLKKVLLTHHIAIHPKRPAGRKKMKRDEVASFIAKNYPDGVPAGITGKTIARDIQAKTGLPVSERTVRRALGRR